MIEIRKISKSYDGTTNVVDELSLTVPTGSVFGFLGPNGSGKTTTIKMLVGINTPDIGTIAINGKHPILTSTRESISFMPEEPNFYTQLTGMEFLEFSNNLFEKSHNRSKKELNDILLKVGIFEAKDRKIKTYSKGMKQRLGFAQALVNDPDYIFLDEPLEGLDPIGRRDLKKMVEELKSNGKTVFFNSHILADVETLCDQIGVIHRGKLIYSGPVYDFKKDMPLEEKFVQTIRSLEDKK